VNGDALKSTTVVTSPCVRELKAGEHELSLTGIRDPFTTIRDRLTTTARPVELRRPRHRAGCRKRLERDDDALLVRADDRAHKRQRDAQMPL
jgi:hypothetical protein